MKNACHKIMDPYGKPSPSVSTEQLDHSEYEGQPASLARGMPGWLYLFPVIPRPTTCRAARDSLKTKALVSFF